MTRRRLLWQLYPSFLIITIVCLMTVGWFSAHAIRLWYESEVDKTLRMRVGILARELAEEVAQADWREPAPLGRVAEICRNFASPHETRVTLLRPDGNVLVDTEEHPEKMDNHAQRAEIVAALTEGAGSVTRFSATTNRATRYYAEPLRVSGNIVAVLRTGIPVSTVDAVLHGLYWKMFLGGLASATLAAGAIWIISRRISRPLEEMRHGAERYARGDWRFKLAAPDTDEMAGLATALNQMAAQLEERLGTVIQQRNEREAVLSSMVEGVLAVDAE